MKTCPEAARDLELLIKLVGRTPGQQTEKVFDSKKIPVWIKAAIDKKALRLEQRRKPKGKTGTLTDYIKNIW